MAQKTPLTALTIDYADRWNGTWFAELSAFSYKLIEDYHLRFLITYFLRIKKQWLSLLSLNHSGGFLFFQIMACYAHAKVKSKSMLFPTQQGKVYLEDWQQQFENKINKLTIFQNLNADVWQKKLPVKKQNMWNYLHNTLLVQNTYNLAGTFFSALRQHATLSIWFDNKQVKSTLTLLSQPIANVLLTAQHNNNSLIYSIQQKFINCINSCKVIKAKMKYLQNVDWLVFLPMVYNSKKTKNYYFLYSVNKSFVEKNNVLKSKVTHMQLKKDLIQKRLFSQECRALVKLNNNYSLQICFSHINLQLKEFEVTRQQQLTAKKASVSSYKKKELTLHYFSKKTALYQTIYQSKSYLMRRIFAFKRYSSIKEGFQVFFKRFRFQFALKKTLIMLNTPLIFLAQALKRVTGLRQFFSYLPMNWSYQDYKPVKRYTIFERYGSKKYFVPTFVASHLTMSRGSPTVLVDLLVHKLRHEYQHTQFLSCVEKICRHLMAPPKSNTAYENVICKGIEILFTGKVNGSDRAKQWRFKLGPVHSSTFYTNTREEHAKVITKFGAFNLRFRMKLGSVGLRYLGSGLTFLLQHSFLSTTVPGKSMSSEINKAIRTSGFRRYFSTGLINGKQKYHKNLFIFFLLFIQIFIFFCFLDIFIWHYINTWAFTVLEGDSIFIMFKNSLEFTYASLSTNKYHWWNFIVGSTFANCILIVFMGLFFFNRNRTVLSDEDNLWLPQFIEHHSSWKDQWQFLNYFTWFNNLALIDQQLVRIILLRIWLYLVPFIMNLLFFRVFFWPYFLMGVAFMLYCQFLKFLVNLFYYITCTFLIKFFDIDEVYKHNFQQYFQILLTFTLFYNFLLLVFFFYLHLVAETAILDIISVFYFFYFIIFIFISYLYCVIYLLVYSLYFLVLFCFKINLHNLNQQELLLKKSKFFVCFCLLLFYTILINYFNLI